MKVSCEDSKWLALQLVLDSEISDPEGKNETMHPPSSHSHKHTELVKQHFSSSLWLNENTNYTTALLTKKKDLSVCSKVALTKSMIKVGTVEKQIKKIENTDKHTA